MSLHAVSDRSTAPTPAGSRVPRIGEGPGPRSLPQKVLVKNRDNTLGEMLERAGAAGRIWMKPERCGGAFDPHGCRAVDIARADDLVGLVDVLRHRPAAFITLTLNRSLFLTAELAYRRAQPRVSKVLSALGDVWCATIEPQTKTGEGFIHWHALVFLAKGESLDDLRRRVDRHWSIREKYAEAVVDRETGEELQRAKFRRLHLGRTNVEWAHNKQGVSRYCAKYLVKSWPAVPPWMLDSTTRFRKHRFSDRWYDLQEQIHRHYRKRGSRTEPTASIRVPARTLRERMARSCSALHVFSDVEGEKRFLGAVRVLPIDAAALDGVEITQLGKIPAIRMSAKAEVLSELLRMHSDPVYQAKRGADFTAKLAELDAQWEMRQKRRQRLMDFFESKRAGEDLDGPRDSH